MHDALHFEIVPRPVGERYRPLHQGRDVIDPFGRQSGQGSAIHQPRRPLVTETGTGGRGHCHPAIHAGNAGRHTKIQAQLAEQGATALHMIGNAVAQVDVVVPARCFVQETVEGDQTDNMAGGGIQLAGDDRDSTIRDAGEMFLHLQADLKRTMGSAAVTGYGTVHRGKQVTFAKYLHRWHAPAGYHLL